MKCLDCQKDLVRLEGKREKKFCNSSCRSNYWQKFKRNGGVVKPKKVSLKRIEPLKTESSPLGSQKSNYTINTVDNLPQLRLDLLEIMKRDVTTELGKRRKQFDEKKLREEIKELEYQLLQSTN